MNSIRLQWTSDNSSPSTYIIERSNDGKSFQAIGQVKADELKAATRFSFDDVNIFQPNNYYRIRVTGFKKDKYSETIKINLPNVYSIQAFPNPFNSQFTVRHPAATKGQFIKLFAMDGKPLATKQLQQGTISTSISVTGIAGGMYKVALYNNNHQIAEVQVIKQ